MADSSLTHWNLLPVELQLKYTWRINHGFTDKKQNFFVRIESADGRFIGLGESAGRTTETDQQHIIDEFHSLQLGTVQSPEHLQKLAFTGSRRLHCALETALVHFLAQKQEKSVTEFLQIDPPCACATSYSIPILPEAELAEFIASNQLHRFAAIKLKVDRENAVAAVNALNRLHSGKLRIHANEAFQTHGEVLHFLEKVDTDRIEFLEQPLPATSHHEACLLRERSPVLLIADESVQIDCHPGLAGEFHGINIKLMKCGGYSKAIQQIKFARQNGMKIMLGCMVESSLGIWSALHLSAYADFIDLNSFLFLKNDPAAGLVTESDGVIC